MCRWGVGYGNEKVLNPVWMQLFIILCNNSAGWDGSMYISVTWDKIGLDSIRMDWFLIFLVAVIGVEQYVEWYSNVKVWEKRVKSRADSMVNVFVIVKVQKVVGTVMQWVGGKKGW